jgi:hypothetical protein
MSVYAGPADWWTNSTDDGRTHIATKGIVQANLVLNLDAGVSTSYPGSGTTWTDLSGVNNNGTLTNGPTFNSSNGGSIVFDGSNDYVECGTNLVLTTVMSVCMWAYPSSSWPAYAIFIDKSISGGSPQYRLQRYAGSTSLEFFDGSNIVVGGTITTDQWNFISCSITGGTVKLYINGVSVVQGSAVSPLPTTSNPTYLGAYSGGGGVVPLYTGRISTCSVYNRALTDAEIQQNFNALRGRFGV